MVKTALLACLSIIFLSCSSAQNNLPTYINDSLNIDVYSGKKYSLHLPEEYQYAHTDNLILYPHEDSLEIIAIAKGEGKALFWNGKDTFLNISINIKTTPQIDTALYVLKRDSLLEILNYEPARYIYYMIMVNKPLPDFETSSINGGVITDEDVKGKISVINFWYVGCPPCMAEIPNLNKVGQYFRKHDYQLYAFCKDSGYVKNDKTYFYAKGIMYEDGQKPKKAERFEPIELNAVHGINSANLEEDFKFDGYPTTYIVDKKGIIRYVYNGAPPDIDKRLKRWADMLEHMQY